MKAIITGLVLSVLLSAQQQKKAAIQKLGESDLQVIKTQVAISTLIEFPKDEELAEVTCGDKEFWVVEGKGRFVHIKPSKPGLTTNLNVILKSDRVYSFLLKEISKPGSTKEKPDFKVVVPGDVDELTQLRKRNENLEELVGKYEDEKKKLEQKVEGEKKEAQKKTNDEDPPPPKPPEVAPPKSEVAISAEKPPAEPAPKPAAAQLAVVPAAVLPQPAQPKPSEETPTFRSVTVERREGLLVTSGRLLGRFFRKVGRTLRLY